MKKPTRDEIVRAIRLTWDSLDSHLDYAVKSVKMCPQCGGNDTRYHAKCVREYSLVLEVLSRML